LSEKKFQIVVKGCVLHILNTWRHTHRYVCVYKSCIYLKQVKKSFEFLIFLHKHIFIVCIACQFQLSTHFFHICGYGSIGQHFKFIYIETSIREV
jgi:hypothetical protein